ncbi:hypothetical protein ACLB1Q_18475 [Escherichia coli]
MIGKLHERQQNVPVFLLGDRKPSPQWTGICWSLSMNSPGFWKIPPTLSPDGGVAAMTRYRQQLLPPLFSALMG